MQIRSLSHGALHNSWIHESCFQRYMIHTFTIAKRELNNSIINTMDYSRTDSKRGDVWEPVSNRT